MKNIILNLILYKFYVCEMSYILIYEKKREAKKVNNGVGFSSDLTL